MCLVNFLLCNIYLIIFHCINFIPGRRSVLVIHEITFLLWIQHFLCSFFFTAFLPSIYDYIVGNTIQFIAVVQALLVAGRQLHQLQGHIEDINNSLKDRAVHSGLLRKVIFTASSSSVINTAARLLSHLSKEAADRRDFHNLFIVSDGNFSEV